MIQFALSEVIRMKYERGWCSVGAHYRYVIIAIIIAQPLLLLP